MLTRVYVYVYVYVCVCVPMRACLLYAVYGLYGPTVVWCQGHCAHYLKNIVGICPGVWYTLGSD